MSTASEAPKAANPADLDFADTAEFLSELEARLDLHRLSASQREIVRWLAYAGEKRQLAQPDEISLPSTFYDAVRHLDTDASLRFDPTREQIMTAALLVRGLIVEMDAGEGKTVSAGLAAAVTAATGRTVHVLTANDYLALRDTEWLAPVYESLGLSVEAVLSSMDDDERRHAYATRSSTQRRGRSGSTIYATTSSCHRNARCGAVWTPLSWTRLTTS